VNFLSFTLEEMSKRFAGLGALQSVVR
jgi:hypothetical protein